MGEANRQVFSASQSISFSRVLKKKEVKEMGRKDLGS
jgi:hypothetical protein